VGSHVSLKVFDVLGREIATLVNEELYPGFYEVESVRGICACAATTSMKRNNPGRMIR